MAVTERNRVQCILPIANRCVLFETSERSWHGFSAIRLPPERQDVSRRSIAVYYYTRQRPQAETSPPHSTIYVQRPLPEQIRAGYTLSEADVRALEMLLSRRDTQIKFLYKRELEFTTAIDSIARSVSFRAGRFVTWPLRQTSRLLRRSRRD